MLNSDGSCRSCSTSAGVESLFAPALLALHVGASPLAPPPDVPDIEGHCGQRHRSLLGESEGRAGDGWGVGGATEGKERIQ